MTSPPARAKADLLDEAELLDAPGGPSLRLRFCGPFEGREITWQATLVAQAAVGRPPERRFIQIGPDAADGTVPIQVGLPVERIDTSTVRKAMIMIRRYRRLRRGRYEYGDP
ncbi:hypothetical protein TVNIR_0141 [Thioalkalivibrio nitratireducens DSM 14787]|uniref:Uncharacterized protein n=1 Tax=Thioalkalivibrio nitratireducens (strain DSM 14787 / UNIQEM 213 / ALEN2) TaxID=1255043 RepID=L0DQR4_THIND|nr:hypothetical protein [Thioalkalivibrio nitratireducens]AGA31854.1 hypothetical protein TVNIR_0141 [Thioalkalivibrio nitratireducens DSM 14787]